MQNGRNGVVPCDGPKKSLVLHHSAVLILMPLWIICPFRYCGKSSSAEAGADGDGVGGLCGPAKYNDYLNEESQLNRDSDFMSLFPRSTSIYLSIYLSIFPVEPFLMSNMRRSS